MLTIREKTMGSSGPGWCIAICILWALGDQPVLIRNWTSSSCCCVEVPHLTAVPSTAEDGEACSAISNVFPAKNGPCVGRSRTTPHFHFIAGHNIKLQQSTLWIDASLRLQLSYLSSFRWLKVTLYIFSSSSEFLLWKKLPLWYPCSRVRLWFSSKKQLGRMQTHFSPENSNMWCW